MDQAASPGATTSPLRAGALSPSSQATVEELCSTHAAVESEAQGSPPPAFFSAREGLFGRAEKPAAATKPHTAGGPSGAAAAPGEAASGNELCANASLGKHPAAATALAVATADDTDVSQDIAVEGRGAQASSSAASGLRVRTGSTTTSSTGSGADGVESTIKALNCTDIQGAAGGPISPAGRSALSRCSRKNGADEDAVHAPPGPAAVQAPMPSGAAVQKAVRDPAQAVLSRVHHPGATSQAGSGGAGSGGGISARLLGSVRAESLAGAAGAAAMAAAAMVAAAAAAGAPSRLNALAEDGLAQPPPYIGSAGGSALLMGGSTSGNSVEQMSRAIVRNRSKDWSDQTWERDPLDCK
jgi:hypothetical protein